MRVIGKIKYLLFIFIFVQNIGFAQSGKVSWKRSSDPTNPDLNLFHSHQTVDLPTATTLQKWDLEFEISHRFIPTVNSGIKNFYGLDGPVNMRLALALALSDKTLIALGRSNFNDNIDLWLKYKFVQIRHKTFPLLIAATLGGAWNSDPRYVVISHRSKTDIRNFQAFGQLIFNTLIKKKLGIGVVPSYLYNTDIRFEDETKDTFRMGTYLQYYLSPSWSVLLEWAPYISGYKSLMEQEYNPFTFGIELETGGHFFKIFLSNSKFINDSQYLAGADIAASEWDWRLGFMITRLLKFGKKS